MIYSHPLDALPNWSIFLITVIILYLGSEAGFRLGKIIQNHWPDKSKASVGAMVSASLVLLGFLLAFVTNIALSNFNERRQLVIMEANAIGTAYLRAGYLSELIGRESRLLLGEYVNLRLDALDPTRTEAAINRSEQIQNELWIRAEEVARESPGPTVALYVSSINEIIDLHTQRLSAEMGFRIPPTFLFG